MRLERGHLELHGRPLAERLEQVIATGADQVPLDSLPDDVSRQQRRDGGQIALATGGDPGEKEVQAGAGAVAGPLTA